MLAKWGTTAICNTEMRKDENTEKALCYLDVIYVYISLPPSATIQLGTQKIVLILATALNLVFFPNIFFLRLTQFE